MEENEMVYSPGGREGRSPAESLRTLRYVQTWTV